MPRKKTVPQHLPMPVLAVLVATIFAILWFFVPLLQKSVPEVFTPESSSVEREYQGDNIELPAPSKTSRVSVEQALSSRRSKRTFQQRPVSLKQVSQLLWAAQGVTTNWGGRTAPSAKSAYPLTLYLVVSDVTGLKPGIYQYIPGELEAIHELGVLREGDFATQLAAAGQQSSVAGVPAALILTGSSVDSNVYLEAGHAAQNLYLQVQSLGLGMVTVSGFDDDKVRSLLGLSSTETPIYVIPVGYPQE